jgi:hypothetical protein
MAGRPRHRPAFIGEFHVRVTPDQRQRLDRWAKQDRRSRSDLFRELLAREALRRGELEEQPTNAAFWRDRG